MITPTPALGVARWHGGALRVGPGQVRGKRRALLGGELFELGQAVLPLVVLVPGVVLLGVLVPVEALGGLVVALPGQPPGVLALHVGDAGAAQAAVQLAAAQPVAALLPGVRRAHRVRDQAGLRAPGAAPPGAVSGLQQCSDKANSEKRRQEWGPAARLG